MNVLTKIDIQESLCVCVLVGKL